MAKSVCPIVEDGKPCHRVMRARDMCSTHYRRWQIYGDPLLGARQTRAHFCKGYGGVACGERAHARELCRRHYHRALQDGAFRDVKKYRPAGDRGTCLAPSEPPCERPRYGNGYCSMHNQRFKKYGDPLVGVRVRDDAFRKNSFGYMHRYRIADGIHEYEHRVVMERVLGRPLLRSETVHHINGDRADNRPENLELWSSSQPPGQRVEDKVSWALELLETYAPHYLASNVQIALPLRR